MIYIRVKNENEFVFRNSKVEEIEADDVPIKEEIYLEYLKREINEKFKVKNLQGATFDEIFEEIIPEPVEPGVIEPSPIEKLQAENAELKKQVQETQQSMAEIMNLIAMQQTP